MWDLVLSKQDKDDPGKELVGAELQFGWLGWPDWVKEKSGPPLFPMAVKVAEGIPYTFKELKAPDEYKLAEEVEFVIDKEGNYLVLSGDEIIDTVNGSKALVMLNEKKAPPSTTTEATTTIATTTKPGVTTSTSKGLPIPPTGEGMSTSIYYAIPLLAVGVAAIILLKRRKAI